MKRWFLEKLKLEKKEGVNTYGEKVMGEISYIKGKKEDKVSLIKNVQGEEIVSIATIYTSKNEVINLGDKVEGLEVVYITLRKDFKGRPQFLEVSLKWKVH